MQNPLTPHVPTTFLRCLILLVLSLSICAKETDAAARTWANIGTDFNTGANWGGTAPGSNDVGLFASAPVTQPNLSVSLTIAGLRFSDGSSGYDITSSGGALLTLNGVNTTGSSGTTTASASAFRNDNVSGTTTVDAALNLAPSTGISTIFQEANDGSTLVLNGPITQTGSVVLSLKNGTIQLNGNNSYSGGTSVDAIGTTVVIGNNNGLGTGTFSINNTSAVQAGGGARTISNNIVLAANSTINGSNALTVNGSFTSSGSSTRTLTVDNSATTTLAGNVFLSESDSMPRALRVNGSGSVVIGGVIANNNVGNTLASSLTYSGTGVLTLNNNNTFSGGTLITVAGGTIVANHDGALGTGNVSLTAASVTLTLQNGATNNYISDNVNLSIVSGSTVNLNFNGAPDAVGGLIIDGVAQVPGLYSAANVPEFMGTGTIQVIIPEPSTWASLIMGASLLGSAYRLRGKRS